MDALLGEDEMSPKNRIALICSRCRLVNGQAPPGAKRLEDVGKWRCGGCGTMNGEESEAKKLVASIEKEVASTQESGVGKDGEKADNSTDSEDAPNKSNGGVESDVTQYSDESSSQKKKSGKTKSVPKPAAEADTPRRRSTRTKAGGKKG